MPSENAEIIGALKEVSVQLTSLEKRLAGVEYETRRTAAFLFIGNGREPLNVRIAEMDGDIKGLERKTEGLGRDISDLKKGDREIQLAGVKGRWHLWAIVASSLLALMVSLVTYFGRVP